MSNNIINFKEFKYKKEDQLFNLLFDNFRQGIFNIDQEKKFIKHITLEEKTIKLANNIDFNKLINLQLKKVKDFYK